MRMLPSTLVVSIFVFSATAYARPEKQNPSESSGCAQEIAKNCPELKNQLKTIRKQCTAEALKECPEQKKAMTEARQACISSHSSEFSPDCSAQFQKQGKKKVKAAGKAEGKRRSKSL